MSYSDFDIRDAKTILGLELDERYGAFESSPPREASAALRESLPRRITKATGINTEKARSEYLILPVLDDLELSLGGKINVFSGSEFNVDPARGLQGRVDFLVSRSREQLFIEAPVLAVVEAKNEDLRGGLGQCLAAMVAAQTFNAREERTIPCIGGCVTTGTAWRFLALEGTRATVDTREYTVTELDRVLGVLAALTSA